MKKFVAVAVFAFAFAFAAVASAMTFDLGTRILRRGVQAGPDVRQLQLLLNQVVPGANLPGTTNFGPLTESAVRSFQQANLSAVGGKADGVVGPMTKRALLDAVSGSSSASSAGLPAGCVAGAAFSTTTGQPCVASSLPAGCMPGAAFSSTTGQPCVAGSQAPGSSFNLSGVAGDISQVTLLGSPSNIQVSEGEMRQVAGFEVLATPGSALNVTSVRVDLTHGGSGSSLLPRYINQLALFAGSTQVASVDANSVVRNGNTYSVTFNINNGSAVVPANQRAQMYIGVRANNTIDTGDINGTWTASVNSVRFIDGTGAILTLSPSSVSRSFSFLKLSNNSSVKLRLSEDNNNPKDRTVTVSETQITNDVEMLRFNIRAEGSELRLRKMSFQATSSTDVNKVSSLFKLRYNGNVVDSVSLGATSTTAYLEFTQLNGGVGEIVIPAGSQANFAILADVNSLATFASGNTLKVELLTADYQNNAKFTVEDATGGSLGTTSTNRPGSVTGYTATFRSEGITATINSTPTPSTTINTSGVVTNAQYTVRLNVAASGNDFFIPRNADRVSVGGASASAVAPSPTTSQGIAFSVLNGSNLYTTSGGAGTVSSSVNLISGGIVDPSGRIKISADTTAVVELTVTLSGSPTGQYKIGVLSVNAANTPGGSLSAYPTTPLVNFETPFSTPAF